MKPMVLTIDVPFKVLSKKVLLLKTGILIRKEYQFLSWVLDKKSYKLNLVALKKPPIYDNWQLKI